MGTFPIGLPTKTLTFGRYSGVLGSNRAGTVRFGFDKPMLHVPTGEVVVAGDEAVSILGETGAVQVVVPVTVTDDLVADWDTANPITNQRLKVSILMPGYPPKTQYIDIHPDDLPVMDFDTLTPYATPGGMPVLRAAVTSVGGLGGDISAEDLADALGVPQPERFESIESQLTGRLSETELNGTYAPESVVATVSTLGGEVAAARRSPAIVFLGDSLTALGAIEASRSYGNSYPTLATYLTDGQVLFEANAGVPSDTVQMIAARVQSEVIARKPGQCFVLAGSNSTTKGYAHFADAQDAYEDGIIVRLLAAGIEPILATIPPRDFTRQTAAATNTGPAVYQLSLAWNVFVRAMAVKYRLRLVDLYAAVVDPGTGNYIDGYTDDQVHWSILGVNVVAQAVAAALIAPYRVPSVPLEKDRHSIINLCSSPLFLSGLGSGTGGQYPTGWNGSASSVVAVSLVDPTEGDGLKFGKWMRLTKLAGSTGNVNMIRTLSTFTAGAGVPMTAGDRVGFGLRYRINEPTPDSGKYVTISLNFRGAGGSGDIKKVITPLNQIQRSGIGTIWIEETLPADTVDVRLDIGFSSPSTAVVDIAQGTIYNLSAMGVPTLTSVAQVSPNPTLSTPPNPATSVPGAPANLTVGAVTDTTVPLTLTALAGATAYEVQSRIGEGAWAAAGTPTGTSHTVTGLTATTAYKLRYRGTNAGGYGPWSAVASATTTAYVAPAMRVSDSFNRTDTSPGTLGALDNYAGGTDSRTWAATSQMAVVGNALGGTVTTLRLTGFDTGSVDSFQEIEILAGEGGLYARGADATGAGADRYSCYYDQATTKVVLIKRAAGVTTALWSSASAAFTPGSGQKIGLLVSGTTIAAYINGTLAQSVSDSSIVAGNFTGVRSAASSPWTQQMENYKQWNKAA